LNKTYTLPYNREPKVTPLDPKSITLMNVIDIIGSIAIPILLIVAASLAIKFGVSHLDPMVPITHNFSISLPALICSSAGALLLLFLAILIVRRDQVKQAYCRSLGRIVRDKEDLKELIAKQLHPGGRPEGETAEQYKIENKRALDSAARCI